jgi:hypothetical protein
MTCATRVAGLALAAALALGGCSVTSDDEQPGPDGAASPTRSAAADRRTPEQLSAQVLDAAEQAVAGAKPIGSATGETRGGTTLTIDVLSVDPVTDGTLVTMRFSGDGSGLAGPAGFADKRYNTQEFARTLALVDRTVTKSRYLPLQFDDYREACTCPVLQMELGAEPQTVTALYPPLPEGVTTVDLVANDIVTVEGLPVRR